MSNYSEFFFGAKGSISELELIELSHPSFSKTYYLVRNHPLNGGVLVYTELGFPRFFEYYPMRIANTDSATNLDQTMTITFGDLGGIIPQEIDNIRVADTFLIYPTLLYRTYRSDDLTTPLFGPIRFQVRASPRQKNACTLNIAAPRLNQNATGERYDMNRFAGLRAF